MTGEERNVFGKCQPAIVKPDSIVNPSHEIELNQ